MKKSVDALHAELMDARSIYADMQTRVRGIINRVPERHTTVNSFNRDVTRTAGSISLGALEDGSAVELTLKETIDSFQKWDGLEARPRSVISAIAERFCPKDTRYTDGGIDSNIWGLVSVSSIPSEQSDTSKAIVIGKTWLSLPVIRPNYRGGGDFVDAGLFDTLVYPRSIGRGNFLEPGDAVSYVNGILSLAEAAVGIHKPEGSVPPVSFALGQEFLLSAAATQR